MNDPEPDRYRTSVTERTFTLSAARALVPEVLVNGDQWSLVRPRMDVDALIALDRMPNWL